MRKWTPSASQRKAFAERMKDSDEKAAYEQRKIDRNEKRKASSKFSYNTAGGSYIPTQSQYNTAMSFYGNDEQQDACNQVIYGYSCQAKVHHDYIHIINEIKRKNENRTF